VAKPLKTARPHPAASPTAVKAAPKPTAAAESREAEEAWQFYQEAVSRDISDQEKIELLESMVERFGEKQAPRVQAELDKLRKRVKRAQTP
jgi:molecular chaperone GrpE (heat shock protein)